MDVLDHMCQSCHLFDGASVRCARCLGMQCRDCIQTYVDDVFELPDAKVCLDCYHLLTGYCHGCRLEQEGGLAKCSECDKLHCMECLVQVSRWPAEWYCKSCLPLSDTFQQYIIRNFSLFDQWDQLIAAFIYDECHT
jgi:hypothetical protein